MNGPAVALRLAESLLWAVHRRTLDTLERDMRRALRDHWTRQEAFFLRRSRESLQRLGLREAAQPVPPPAVSIAVIDAALEVLDKFQDIGNAKLIDKAVSSAFIGGAEYVARETGFQLSFNLKSPRAQAYLATRSMERLGKDIDATTKNVLRKVITQGYQEQWSIRKLTKEIQATYSGFRRKRAELITITELGEAYSNGSVMQARDMENSGTPMQKAWAIAPMPCPTCEMNPPAGWISINSLFPSGHDRPLAHPSCFPGDQLVSSASPIAVTERFFDGEIIIVKTASGHKFTCTPNHPILTPWGWVAAQFLKHGYKVISTLPGKRPSALFDVNEGHAPATIKEVADAFRGFGNVGSRKVKSSAPHFHGDGKGSDIAIVWANSLLLDDIDSTGAQHFGESDLIRSNVEVISLARGGSPAKLFVRPNLHLGGGVRGGSVSRVLLRCPHGHTKAVSIADVAQINSRSLQPPMYGPAGSGESFRETLFGPSRGIELRDFIHGEDLPNSAPWYSGALQVADHDIDTHSVDSANLLASLSGQVFTDNIVSIDSQIWQGVVYNLQTPQGAYTADSVVVSNCRCALLVRATPLS